MGRQMRVEELRRQYASGRYKVDQCQLALKIMARAFGRHDQ